MLNLEDNNTLLIKAASEGNAEEVLRLIPLSDLKAKGVVALGWAATKGHTQCVALLVPVCGAKISSKPLCWAAGRGHTECVELLIPVSDPKDTSSEALRLAAENGHTQCVARLIPVSAPKALNSYALRWAVREGHTQCMEMLYPVSDPVVALQRLQEDFPNDDRKWKQLYEMIETDRLNTVLYKEIDEKIGRTVHRKM